MPQKLILFGGCTGIGKSDILKTSLEKFSEDNYVRINIADFFTKSIISDRDNVDAKIIWHKEQWKYYDKQVLEELKKKLSACGNKVVIINMHFATISPYGYLPGIDLFSFDELLKQHILLSKVTKGIDILTFGLLLIDTSYEVMCKHYEEELKDHAILHYISTDYMVKDLEENRKWASIYYSRAYTLLPKSRIINDTVYIYDNNKRNDAINEISTFIQKFNLAKK